MATEPRKWYKLQSALDSITPRVPKEIPVGIQSGAECKCSHPDCPLGCTKDCECQTQWRDLIPGGLADNKTPADFDKEQLKAGMKVELEHTSNARLALEIAMDHISERSDYYTILKLTGL